MSIMDNLPALPSGVRQPIIYTANDVTYLADPSFVIFRALTLGDDGIIYMGAETVTGKHYVLADGVWSATSTGIVSVGSDGQLLYSPINVYNSDGEVALYSSRYSNTPYTIGGRISASTIYTGVVSPLFKLVPLLIVPIVGFLAFRKAWSFIKTTIKGA